MGCNTPLGNTGANLCPLTQTEIKRFGFTSTYKEDGSLNKITQVTAATIAGWNALFDKPSFSSSVLEKVVMTPIIYGATPEQSDPSEFDEDGFFKKLADGDYMISFKVNDGIPELVKGLKTLENTQISVYLFDTDNRVWAPRDSTDLVPLRIINIKVPNFNLASRSTPSQEIITFRLQDPTKMNDLQGVTITDGDVYDDSDFYGLFDATGVATSPATGSVVLTIATDAGWGSAAVTGIADADIIFYDDAAPTVPITVSTGTIVESPNGTYTVTEAAIFTTAHTYQAKIPHDGYDIDAFSFTIP